MGFILCTLDWIIEVVFLYALPLVATLLSIRDSKEKNNATLKRWLLHWILVMMATNLQFKSFARLPENINYSLRILFTIVFFFLDKLAFNFFLKKIQTIYGYLKYGVEVATVETRVMLYGR